MTRRLELHPYQLFPADPLTRSIARTPYAEIADLPIVSLHGHTDPTGLTEDHNWTDATSLPLAPDHYFSRDDNRCRRDIRHCRTQRRHARLPADPCAVARLVMQTFCIW